MKNILLSLVALGFFSSASAAKKIVCPSTFLIADTKKTVVEQPLDLSIPLVNTGLGSINETVLKTAAYEIEQTLIADSTVDGLYYLSVSFLDLTQKHPDPQRNNINFARTIIKASHNDKPNFFGTEFVMLMYTSSDDNSGGYVLLSEATTENLRKVDPWLSSLISQMSAGPNFGDTIKKALKAGYIKNKEVIGISTHSYCSLVP